MIGNLLLVVTRPPRSTQLDQPFVAKQKLTEKLGSKLVHNPHIYNITYIVEATHYGPV